MSDYVTIRSADQEIEWNIETPCPVWFIEDRFKVRT